MKGLSGNYCSVAVEHSLLPNGLRKPAMFHGRLQGVSGGGMEVVPAAIGGVGADLNGEERTPFTA
jgi:hypothetical protein